ncbi:MAG: electron transfer flavoprotein subunit beta/FixA family protein [Deltaproteobacteria bacterium]|nr:electron transfer flavoprotein subunit beta/FixA family protein [Deltaproteobacteria bacterium]
MKILVCVKQVPDNEGAISINNKGTWLTGGGAFRMNRFDEFALEEAVRIGEEIPDTGIEVVSVGPGRVVSTLRQALERGAAVGTHILVEEERYMSPFETASLIASFAGTGHYDLIIAGVMAEDDMHCQVGQMIAAILKIRCATSVIHRGTIRDGTSVYIEREIEEGQRLCMEVALPAVLTVQSGINRPRYPSLSNILRAKGQEIRTIDASDLWTGDGRDRLISMRRPEASAKGVFLEGDRDEKARALVGILHERALI